MDHGKERDNEPAVVPQNKNVMRFDLGDKLAAVLVVICALLAGAFGSDQYHLLMILFVFLTICITLFDYFRHLTHPRRWQFFTLLVIASAFVCGLWEKQHQLKVINSANPIDATENYKTEQAQVLRVVPATKPDVKKSDNTVLPYVGIEEISVVNVAPGLIPQAKIKFKNFGSIPANKVRINTEFMSLSQPLPLEYQPKYNKNVGSVSFMMPGSERVSLISGEAIDEQWLESLKKKEIWLYVFGTITYTDNYNDNHFLDYCVIYDPDNEKFKDCSFHNDSK